MKPASEKQIKFAATIANQLKLQLPQEKTAQAYFLFIQENIESFNHERRSIECYDYEEQFYPIEDTF